MIRVVGVVQRKDTGRPEIAYGRRCKPSEIAHEVNVAELEILLGLRIERGVKIGKAEPDGVSESKGRKFAIELDYSGKMTQKQMQEKWKRYGDVKGYFVLVVAMTEARMERLRKGSKEVKIPILFTTFDRLRSGAKEPCVDWKGNKARI